MGRMVARLRWQCGFTYPYDKWPVPGNPQSAPQVDYLFDAIQYSGTIFQPVLAWGCEIPNGGSCNMGGSYYWISAESCNSGCAYTSPIQVGIGHTIEGSIDWHSSGCGLKGLQPYYAIFVYDTTGLKSATLNSCSYPKGDQVNAGALEVDGVSSCNQLPNTSSETFCSVSVTLSTRAGL
jgi:hypothetical protein